MLTVAISAVLGVFRQEREMPRSFDMLDQCEDKQGDDEICAPNEKHDTIQCGRCGHNLADPEDIINIETSHCSCSLSGKVCCMLRSYSYPTKYLLHGWIYLASLM